MNNNINIASMLRVGTFLRGIYRIDRYLSSGGFGNTYVATNVEFDEIVAIKEFFIKGVSQRDGNNTTVSVSNSDNTKLFDSQLQKFKKEARRIRKLKNEHIVQVHDLFEENGTAYYVMDYIDGESLSERMDRTHKPLSENDVLKFYPQILDALQAVHSKGIFHLDLKPGNIMVDANGNVKLIDFGASKQQSNAEGAKDSNSTLICFTNGYAPREQMERNFEKIGPWTDIYALGATLYALLTHQQPPMPTDIDDDRSSDKHLALPLPSNVSDETRDLILKLMKTDRLDRPQSVDELLIEDAKEIPKLAFKEDFVSAQIGDKFIAPALSYAEGFDGTVVYKSSNPTVATVDASTGVVIIVGAGTTTISAYSEATNHFSADSAYYMLKVSKPEPVPPTLFDFSKEFDGWKDKVADKYYYQGYFNAMEAAYSKLRKAKTNEEGLALKAETKKALADLTKSVELYERFFGLEDFRMEGAESVVKRYDWSLISDRLEKRDTSLNNEELKALLDKFDASQEKYVEPNPEPKPPVKKDPSEDSFFNKNKKTILLSTLAAVVGFFLIFSLLNQGANYHSMSEADPADTTAVEEAQPWAEDMSYSNPTMGEGKYTGIVDDLDLPHDPEGLFKSETVEYRGAFVHGVAEGKATYKIQDQTFEGTFKNNEYANGTITMSDGTFFKGSFKGGQPFNGAWYKKSGEQDAKVVDGKEVK